MLLTNIYAGGGNGHLCTNVEQQWKARGVRKQPGHTWIEVNNEVHMFVVDKQDHLKMIEICAELQRLSVVMCDVGYVPYTEFILHDMEEEEMCFICVTRVRNWLLYWGLSRQLLVLSK